jgi:hypothetical protein
MKRGLVERPVDGFGSSAAGYEAQRPEPIHVDPIE